MVYIISLDMSAVKSDAITRIRPIPIIGVTKVFSSGRRKRCTHVESEAAGVHGMRMITSALHADKEVCLVELPMLFIASLMNT
jgi:hypothetical protein